MPTYEYKCEVCGYLFEKLQSMKSDPIKKCPKCNGNVKRLISGGVGVISKGSATDYSQNDSLACGRDRPCCGRDTPCDNKHCES